MRKIILSTSVDLETFEPVISIFEALGNGKKDTLFQGKAQPVPESRYTPEEQAKIDLCNKALTEKGKKLLTGEEIDYMLDPAGMSKRLDYLDQEMDNPENLQKLAGFKVEKKIVPLGKGESSE